MLQAIIDAIGRTGLSPDLSEFLGFFIYDTAKILIMLIVMISLIGFIRTYIPTKRIKTVLSKLPFGTGNLAASLFGAVTPFCSCSSIPIFISFIRAGIPLGTTFSFLITSPIINEYLVVLMLAAFGWKITATYVVMGLLIGTISGMILGKMKLEKHIMKDMKLVADDRRRYVSVWSRAEAGVREALATAKGLILWVAGGVLIGSAIHNFVPDNAVQAAVSAGGVMTVPIVTLIGVPLYGNCAAIVPIAVALFQKGIPLGTALSFMMAVSALSFPEAVILRRVMDLRLILVFFGIVTAAIIMNGYIFNLLQPLLA
jgi:uncharacterized protein